MAVGPDGREIRPECNVCGLRKKPLGRSDPLEAANGMCDSDCKGYCQRPLPSSYWRPDEPSMEVSDDI